MANIFPQKNMMCLFENWGYMSCITCSEMQQECSLITQCLAMRVEREDKQGNDVGSLGMLENIWSSCNHGSHARGASYRVLKLKFSWIMSMRRHQQGSTRYFSKLLTLPTNQSQLPTLPINLASQWTFSPKHSSCSANPPILDGGWVLQENV